MLKLTEVYSEIIQEGANEEQAQETIMKTMNNIEELNNVNDSVKKTHTEFAVNGLKKRDPTTQNKYLPLIAYLLSSYLKSWIPKMEGDLSDLISDFFELYIDRDILQKIYEIEKQIGAKLQFSKKKGFFFNKDIEIANITAGESISKAGGNLMHPLNFRISIDKAYRSLTKYKMLKQGKAKREGDVNVQIDGKGERRVLIDESNIKIEAILSHEVCVSAMKEGGGDFCIKDQGWYNRERKNSTFYAVHDRKQGGNASFVLVQIFADDNTKLHDLRNAGDDKVEMDNGNKYDIKEYFTYLRQEYNILSDDFFEHIPVSIEEELENIVGEDFKDIVGQYIIDEESGEVYDAIKVWLGHEKNAMMDSEWERIKLNDITNALRGDYLMYALKNQSVHYIMFAKEANNNNNDPVVEKVITKFVERYINNPSLWEGTDFESPQFISTFIRLMDEDKIDDFTKALGEHNIDKLMITTRFLSGARKDGDITDQEFDNLVLNFSEDIKDKLVAAYAREPEIPPFALADEADEETLKDFAENFVWIHDHDRQLIEIKMEDSYNEPHPRLKDAIEEELEREDNEEEDEE